MIENTYILLIAIAMLLVFIQGKLAGHEDGEKFSNSDKVSISLLVIAIIGVILLGLSPIIN